MRGGRAAPHAGSWGTEDKSWSSASCSYQQGQRVSMLPAPRPAHRVSPAAPAVVSSAPGLSPGCPACTVTKDLVGAGHICKPKRWGGSSLWATRGVEGEGAWGLAGFPWPRVAGMFRGIAAARNQPAGVREIAGCQENHICSLLPQVYRECHINGDWNTVSLGNKLTCCITLISHL